MWRQASLPAVEGGILPPGKTVHLSKRSHFTMTFPVATQFRRAGSPGSTSAKMADATIFRQALKRGHRHGELDDDVCIQEIKCPLRIILRPSTRWPKLTGGSFPALAPGKFSAETPCA
jgi:hypothetical protein